jgi:hypothetical protein
LLGSAFFPTLTTCALHWVDAHSEILTLNKETQRKQNFRYDVPAVRLLGPGAAVTCDEKVANREIRVWHLVIESGY